MRKSMVLMKTIIVYSMSGTNSYSCSGVKTRTMWRYCSPLYGVIILMLVCFPSINGLPTGTKIPKKYMVNLDLRPEQRWQQVALDNTDFIKDVHSILRSYVPANLLPYIELIATDIDKYIKHPYAGEMRGFANALNISVGDMVMANLMYDVSAFCTSIVSQDAKGQIWHSRNLDYGFTDILKNLTIAVDFQSANKTVYSVITFAGYIGVMSGQRPNAFTITVDERDQGSLIWNLVIGILDRNTSPTSFLVRDALAKDVDFNAAVDRLSYTTTAAGSYFIIGGVKPGDGAVITKGRFAPDDVWKLDSTSGRWFLVETNYDHWTTPPPSDDRRDPSIKAMTALGQKSISVASLFDVMSIPKVLNKHTTYTVVMSAALPELMQSWIRL